MHFIPRIYNALNLALGPVGMLDSDGIGITSNNWNDEGYMIDGKVVRLLLLHISII